MKTMHWKRVIIYSSIMSATFYIAAFAYFWLQPVPPMRCMRGLTLSGTKTHVKQRFLPLTPLLMVSDVLWSPVLPA